MPTQQECAAMTEGAGRQTATYIRCGAGKHAELHDSLSAIPPQKKLTPQQALLAKTPCQCFCKKKIWKSGKLENTYEPICNRKALLLRANFFIKFRILTPSSQKALPLGCSKQPKQETYGL